MERSPIRLSPRNRTGLRNRRRNGRGTYSRMKKSRIADRYGEFENGARKSPDRIVKWEQPERNVA